ncbi:MAG TPA: hypothetical protein VG096_06105 [Bryobacteraceae bacterium]|nr:hypothetical protein [Bryobacteraceae bacterium]
MPCYSATRIVPFQLRKFFSHDCFRRKQYDDLGLRGSTQRRMYTCQQIDIGGDDVCAIKESIDSILNQPDRYVYIRHLFSETFVAPASTSQS